MKKKVEDCTIREIERWAYKKYGDIIYFKEDTHFLWLYYNKKIIGTIEKTDEIEVDNE